MPAPDPTAGFTDIQWYMYHQRNVAYFAAFTVRVFTDAELLEAVRRLVDLAPQLTAGFDGPLPDAVLRALIERQDVASLEGFPDLWLDRGERVFLDPKLPLFRLRYAAASDRGFILVQVAHALVEGADSALLSRSQSAAHPVSGGRRDTAPWVNAAALVLGGVVAPLHMLVGNLQNIRPGPYRAATRVYPRAIFTGLARSYGVRQRSLFYALALATLFGGGTPEGKRRVSTTYSVIDEGGGADRDAFMRMRMRFAVFENRDGFAEFVRAVDERLSAAESRESGFNAKLNAGGIRVHRRLSRVVPFAYTPKMFQFLPYDAVLGLIPPHRLTGRLTAGLTEPVYAGAALEGANACVIVPNRQFVTFNFYIQQKLLDRIGRLDELLRPVLIPGSESVS